MGETKIEWTDATWNPVRGCTKVSPGCKHCYAETFAERWRGIPGHAYECGFDPRFAPDQLDAPLHWRKPRRVFVNSMSDLFHEAFTNEQIAAVYGVMAACQRHTFQILTKRPSRRRQWFAWLATRFALTEHPWLVSACWWAARRKILSMPEEPRHGVPWPLPNVWEGVSVEDRKYGLPRIAELRQTPAAVRFLSCEPLLEDLGEIDLTGIDWVIAGAESGRGARPMHEDWVRSLRDQCAAAGVRFFYKQRLERGRKVSLPMLDGRQHAEWPVTP